MRCNGEKPYADSGILYLDSGHAYACDYARQCHAIAITICLFRHYSGDAADDYAYGPARLCHVVALTICGFRHAYGGLCLPMATPDYPM